jgi:dGTP triphosphohydrolase
LVTDHPPKGEVGSHLAREMFRSSVERLNLVAKEHFSNKETLFLTSAFSVSKSDLPQLKAELKELILKFVDRTVEAERTEETVVQIVTGLFEGRLALPNRG